MARVDPGRAAAATRPARPRSGSRPPSSRGPATGSWCGPTRRSRPSAAASSWTRTPTTWCASGAGAGPSRVPLPGSDRDRVVLLIGRRGRHGVAHATLEVAAGLRRRRGWTAALAAAADDASCAKGTGGSRARSSAETEADLLAVLRRHHEAHPLEPGMSAQAWRAAAAVPRAELVELAERAPGAAPARSCATGPPSGSPAGRRGAVPPSAPRPATILGALERGRRGASQRRRSWRRATRARTCRPSLRLLAQQGIVVAVGRDRYYARAAFDREREAVLRVLRELGGASPAVIRERLGRSRKWLIPLLEQLDRDGVTVRRGDVRVLADGRGVLTGPADGHKLVRRRGFLSNLGQRSDGLASLSVRSE